MGKFSDSQSRESESEQAIHGVHTYLEANAIHNSGTYFQVSMHGFAKALCYFFFSLPCRTWALKTSTISREYSNHMYS